VVTVARLESIYPGKTGLLNSEISVASRADADTATASSIGGTTCWLSYDVSWLLLN